MNPTVAKPSTRVCRGYAIWTHHPVTVKDGDECPVCAQIGGATP